MLDFMSQTMMQYIILAMGVALIIMFILVILSLSKVSKLKKRCGLFFKNSKGESLEEMLVDKLDRLDEALKIQGEVLDKVEEIKQKQDSCISKTSIYKYRAFREMGGDTSFVLALLDNNNNGTLINGMTGSEATYIYAKGVKEGIPEVELSKEEMIALEDCVYK